MSTIIELKDITKIYQMGGIEVHALSGVSLSLEEEELTSIMGPSGSGKSTLMNIMGCLDKPSSGSYKLEGIEVATLDDDKLAEIRNRRIGFIFQNYSLLPRVSALENVELPLIYSSSHNKDRRRLALQALEQVNLLDRASHKPNELSGGQQQRVAIARVLVQNPAIILADEPTGNLDSYSSKEIIELFINLNQTSKITIILVTHDRDVASCSRRIIHIHDGKISADELIR